MSEGIQITGPHKGRTGDMATDFRLSSFEKYHLERVYYHDHKNKKNMAKHLWNTYYKACSCPCALNFTHTINSICR